MLPPIPVTLNRTVIDMPLLDLANDPVEDVLALATPAFEQRWWFAALIRDDQAPRWRELARHLHARLHVDVTTQTTTLPSYSSTLGRGLGHGHTRLAVMVLDAGQPSVRGGGRGPVAHYGVRSADCVPDGLHTATRLALEKDAEQRQAAERSARIAATPDVARCTYRAYDALHTHECQRDCCPAACDLVTSELDKFLASAQPSLEDLDDYDEDDNGTVLLWIEEALGRSDFWDPRDPLLILRDLRRYLPRLGQAEAAETGGAVCRLSSLCAAHQEKYPQILRWEHANDGSGFCTFDEIYAELTRRITLEL